MLEVTIAGNIELGKHLSLRNNTWPSLDRIGLPRNKLTEGFRLYPVIECRACCTDRVKTPPPTIP